MSDESATFHKLAKDAGNRLGNYVLNYASGATAVFFLALMQDSVTKFTSAQKTVLLLSLVFFFATVALRLFELHIDSKRAYYVAKQLEKPQDQQDWSGNASFKVLRWRLILSAYFTLIAGTLFALLLMVLRLI
jgi:hypothetical protein